MKYTYCMVAALAISLLFTGPSFAEEKQADSAASASLDGKPIKGKVLETMDSAGYTYLHIDAPEGKIWVAVPQSKVEVGKEVTANPGMVMSNFESKTLNKTFDVIVFSSGMGGPNMPSPQGQDAAMGGMGGQGSSFAEAMQAESGMGSPHGAMGGAMGGGAAMESSSGGSATAIVAAAEIKLDKAEGDNGLTIEECFSNAKEMNNKKVQVRGKVMKVSRMIMGKNWLHLQDGTGNPMKNTHDLVVTTMAEPEVDSVVLVEGVLYSQKDFGAGYKYEVIIEDAEVK